MKRREFIKIGVGAAALAAIPSCTKAPMADSIGADFESTEPLNATNHGLAPRRVELMDFDWRFKPMPNALKLKNTVAIDNWVWTPGTADQAEMMTKPELDTSTGTWKPTDTANAQMNYVGYAWFRTTLPQVDNTSHTIQFTHVDDNGTVYLNGKLLKVHRGWDSSFQVNLDTAWRTDAPNVLTVLVHNTDGTGGIYGAVTLGSTPGAETYYLPSCDDSTWRKVQLPQDYIVEGRYSSKANTGHGSLPVYPAWYRKSFTLPTSDTGKSIWLYFEGVYRDAQIYVNGVMVGRHPGGYTSFHVDISNAVQTGVDNLLAIYVDPTDFEGWWYEGGGIYRHVWLNVADHLHVAPWGVYAISEVSDVLNNPSAKVTIETTVSNRTIAPQSCAVQSRILDPDGQVVAEVTSSLSVPSDFLAIPTDELSKIIDTVNKDEPSYLHTGTKLTQEVSLPAVRLWSLEERNRYTVETAILRDGTVVDRHSQKFGIRTLRFEPNAGFFLNEKHVELKGVCNHQDFAGVGIGMPDSILYYRMKRLQEFGCNAIRCSHNPMTPSMYDACDELGLVVMDENRHPGSTIAVKSWVGQKYNNTWHVESMVLRDRNHPSVIMWSMWNEEFAIQTTVFGREMMAALMKAVHKHDRTRPVTCAFNHGLGQHGWLQGASAAEDILGVNYNYQDFDWLHKAYPDKMIFGSEIGSDTECRGIYHTNKVTAHLTSYMSPGGSWHPLGTRKFVAGGFYWTGFDYRGETYPFGWPEINSNFGFLDMCGFPKDAAYYWKAWWMRGEPLVHIFPHWNWPGKAGQNVPVWCFSNCEQVELFLNGKSLGKKPMLEFRHLQWNHVLYQPGRLEAKGYIKGRVVTTTVVETTGAPAAIRLTPTRANMIADGQDTVPVAVAIVDAQGRVVPTADNMVHFAVTGRGRNAGVGNGDPSCHEPNQANFRSAFNGLCMVLVQATRRAGRIALEVRSDGLKSASVTFQSSAPPA